MSNPQIALEPSPSIQDSLGMVLRNLQGMWRFRWLALAAAWAMALCIWIFVYMMPDTFKASARVYVDTDSVLRPLLRGLTVENDVESDVSVMTRIMTSRPILEEVVRQADLDLTIETPLQMEGLLSSLAKRIEISGSLDNLYEITFVDVSREKALNVVRKLLDTFVSNTLGSGYDDAQQAGRALEKEIADYERRLTVAEDRLTEFKRKNVGMMPGDGGDYYDQLQRALEARAHARDLARVAEQKVASVERRLEGEDPVVGIMSSGIGAFGSGRGTSVDGPIASAEQQLNELMQVYTEKHPAVVRTNALLDDLRQQRRAELAKMPDRGEASGPLESNPVYQNLRIQHNNLVVERSSLREDLAAKEAEVERLEGLVDVIPQIEGELARLNRDYDVVKDRYETMLARWEDLQTAKRVSSGTDGVQFRVIDPPFSPTAPAGPNRTLFIIAGLIVALGAGGGLAFALNLFSPVYLSSKELASTGIPVLGSVGTLLSEDGIAGRYRSNMVMASAAAGLVVAAVVVIAFSEAGSEVVRRLTA
jgi:polysaccharide chain length determinant protein (PEP-CTERM system associated)